MLPGELLLGQVKAGVATAFQLEHTTVNLEMAAEYIAMFTDFNGLSRGDLDEALLELEGDLGLPVFCGLEQSQAARLCSNSAGLK